MGVYRCGFARTQAAYDRAEAELFAFLGELEATLLSRGPGICGSQLTPGHVVLFSHPDPDGDGLRPPVRLQAAKPPLGSPRPLWGLAAALPWSAGRAEAHLLPGGLGGAISVPCSAASPRDRPAGPDLAHWCLDLQGAPAMTETISEQPGGQKGPATGPADPVLRGSTGSTHHRHRDGARCWAIASPCWAVAAGQASCSAVGATAGTVLWALAARDERLGPRPGAALDFTLMCVPLHRARNCFWLGMGWPGRTALALAGGTAQIAAHIGADSAGSGRWDRSSPPFAGVASKNFSASAAEAVGVTLAAAGEPAGPAHRPVTIHSTAFTLLSGFRPGTLLLLLCLPKVRWLAARRCGRQGVSLLTWRTTTNPRTVEFDQPGGSRAKTSASNPVREPSRCMWGRRAAGLIAPTGLASRPMLQACWPARRRPGGSGNDGPSPRSRW